MSDPDYCDGCYSAAKKAGRKVRLTTLSKYTVCSLCEGRMRNGLIQYHPSNGTEFNIFLSDCHKCRHFDDGGLSDHKIKACKWGVLDQLLNGMFEENDSLAFWFDPKDLTRFDAKGEILCPAQCLRFTNKGDSDGERYDPPPKDVDGQMFLGEMLTAVEMVLQEAVLK